MRRFSISVLCVCAAGLLAGAAAPLGFLIFDSGSARPGTLPEGWRVKAHRGTPDVAVIREGREHILHLKSRNTSFALERAVDINPAQTPFLTWRWKVTELPRGADFRLASADDQAAQVMVAFDDRRIIAYIWDTTAPKDTVQSASPFPLVHLFAFVCRSGESETNRWLAETRNVADDYRRVFGREPSRIKGVRLQINSQHTGSSAESFFGDVAFRNTPG